MNGDSPEPAKPETADRLEFRYLQRIGRSQAFLLIVQTLTSESGERRVVAHVEPWPGL